MSATEPLQHRGAAISLMQMLQTQRRQCQARQQAQSSQVVSRSQSSSQSRVESASASPRTPIPRNDSSSTVGGGSAASSPGQTAASMATAAADEPLAAVPASDTAMHPAVELVCGSESQLEEGELISGSARLSEPQPEAEPATASSLATAGRQFSRLNSCAETNLLPRPATTATAATSNLSPPNMLLVAPADAATAMDDESADEQPSAAAAAAPAPATDLMRDSSDDSCVSIPAPASRQLNCWSSCEPAHRFQAQQPSTSPTAGLFPCFDRSLIPTALSTANASVTNQLLDQLEAWLAAIVGGQPVSSPPSLERAPSELAELLSKLTVARQRTGELALESEEASALDSSRIGSCEVPGEEEELQWLDELIAVVKRSVQAEAASEADTQRPRPYEPVSLRVQSLQLLAPEDESTAVWRLEQQSGSDATPQNLLSAACPLHQASSAEPLGSPAPPSFWQSLPELPDHDSHAFGSPPPLPTLPAPALQPWASNICPWPQSHCDAQTQTAITGAMLDRWEDMWRNAVSRAAAAAAAAASAATAATASPPPTGLACSRSLRSKQTAVAAAATAASPTSSNGQVAQAAQPAQQDSAAMHCGDAQPERVMAAAVSKATKTARARPTRSQSGAATLPAPPVRETSGSKRSRQESSESLHAQVTLNKQLMDAAAAADSATTSTESTPAESQLASAPAVKRHKSISSAAQQAEPPLPLKLVASVVPKKKAITKGIKSNTKAKASAPSEPEGDAPAAAGSAPASPAKAEASASLAADEGNDFTNSEPQVISIESTELKSTEPAVAEDVKTPQAKTERKECEASFPIASALNSKTHGKGLTTQSLTLVLACECAGLPVLDRSPPKKSKPTGRKDLLRVGVVKRSKDEVAESLDATANKESMQVDSCAAAVVIEEPAAAAAVADASTATDAVAAAPSSTLPTSLPASNAPKPSKREQERARLAEIAGNAKKLWHIVRDRNVPNTVSHAELRELMGWSPQKAISGMRNILRHWATDGIGPPTPEVNLELTAPHKLWKTHCPPAKGGAPKKAAVQSKKSTATAVAFKHSHLLDPMSDQGSSSQSASALQRSGQPIVSSPMLVEANLKSEAPPAPSVADLDMQMQAPGEDQLHAPGSSPPTPISSIEQMHFTMHAPIDKRQFSN